MDRQRNELELLHWQQILNGDLTVISVILVMESTKHAAAVANSRKIHTLSHCNYPNWLISVLQHKQALYQASSDHFNVGIPRPTPTTKEHFNNPAQRGQTHQINSSSTPLDNVLLLS